MAIHEQFVSDETRAALVELVAGPRLAAMRETPGFADVSRRLVAIWREHAGEDDKAYAHHLRDLGRFTSGVWALYLNSTPGGVTTSRLGALLAWSNVAGAGRARALMVYLRFIGYVAAVPAGGDAREKRFVPTERLVRAVTTRLSREFAAMAPLNSDFATVLRHLPEPGAFNIYAELMGESWLAFLMVRHEPTGPSLEMFAQRYAGMMLLSELLATAEPDDVFPPERPMRFQVAALARKAGISRTQVRQLLRDAEVEGLLILTEEGVAQPTAALREQLEFTTAGQILGSAWCAGRFIDRIGQQA